jgi:hypothetical protein
MRIADEVRASLRNSDANEDADETNEALREAERLADLFSDVQPQPYVIPTQRFIGVPVQSKSDLGRG